MPDTPNSNDTPKNKAKATPNKTKMPILIKIAVLVIALALTWLVFSAIDLHPPMSDLSVQSQSPDSAASPQTTPPPKVEEKSPSTVSRVIAFPLLFAILIAVCAWAISDARKPYAGKKGKEAEVPFTDYLKQPTIATIGGVFILNILASLFAYPAWRWYADQPVFFWGTNLGLPIFVHFVHREEKVHKWIATGIAVLIIAGFFFALKEDADKKPEKGTQVAVTSVVERPSYINVPAAIAVPIFCDAESGDGSPGSAKQVNADGSVVRNPPDATPGTGAVGACQIHISDSSVVEFLKKNRITAEEVEKDEVKNREAARLLYQDFIDRGGQGTHPFEDSRHIWEPKLRSYTWGGEAVSLVATAPIGEWSTFIPVSRKMKWSFDIGEEAVMISWNKKGIEEKLPREKGAPNLRPEIVYGFKFKSLEDRPVPVIVEFFE